MSSYMKTEAINRLNRLHQENRIDFGDYSAIHDGLTEMETLCDRDKALEELWAQLGDVQTDSETECLSESFMGWDKGTDIEEIWYWFDQRYSNGVAYLMYRGAEDYVPESRRLYGLKKLCSKCKSRACQYNHGGECRFAMVHERRPQISDAGECIDCDYREGELSE